MKNIAVYTTYMILLLTLSTQAGTYTMDQYLDLVEKHSKDLKLARQDLRLADTDKKEAVSGVLPNISANAGYNRNLNDTYMYADMGGLTGDENAGTTKLPINRNNEYRFSVAVNQTLFNGTVLNAIKAARQYQHLSEFVYDASHQEIITMAKKAFYRAQLLKIVWNVSQASENNALENFIDVGKAYEAGLVSEFDLLQAEVRHLDLVPQTTEARRNYDIALIQLKNLAGLPVDENLSLEGDFDQYPDLPGSATLESILTGRPDYNALLWQERLTKTNVSAQKAAYYPSLSGKLAYGFSSQSDEWSFDDKNEAWVLGVSLNVPIFTGGATRARVQRAKIELDRSRLQLDQAKDNIRTETANIQLRLLEAHKRIQSARAAVTTTQKAFSIAETTSKAGLTTQLELKDSRVMLDQAQLRYYAAVYEYLEAFFDWQKASGSLTLKR